MRTPTGPAADVTYIGPRAFAIGFTLVCGIFVALFLGLDRLTELSEAAPISAESAQAVGFDPPISAATAKSSAPGASPAPAPQALGQMTPVVWATPLVPANRTASTQSIQLASPSAVTGDPLITAPRLAPRQPIAVAAKPAASISASVVAKPVASIQASVVAKPVASIQASVLAKPVVSRQSRVTTKPIASVDVLVAAKPSVPLRTAGPAKSLVSMQSTVVGKPIARVEFVAVRKPSALPKPPRTLTSVGVTQPAVSAKPIVLGKQAAKPVKPRRLPLPPAIARASSPPLLVQFKPATASGQLDPRLVDHGTLLVTPTRPAFSAAVAPTPQPVAP